MENKAEKAPRQNVSDSVYYSIKEKLERNHWLPGDRLPSENDLAQQYGVSRMSVRMALQKLVALGMLSAKNGGGYFVKDFEFGYVVEHISGMMVHNISYEDVNHFRSLVELESLELLRGKPLKPRDLKKMQLFCQQMRRAAEAQNLKAFALADYKFHRHICAMSGNGMFVYSYELIGPLFVEYLAQHYDERKLVPFENDRVFHVTGSYYLDAVAYHEEIVDNLRKGDIAQAKEIVRHLTHAKLS